MGAGVSGRDPESEALNEPITQNRRPKGKICKRGNLFPLRLSSSPGRPFKGTGSGYATSNIFMPPATKAGGISKFLHESCFCRGGREGSIPRGFAPNARG